VTTRTRILASCAALLAVFAVGRFSARAPDTTVDERAEETHHETATVEESAAVEAATTTTQAEAAHVEQTIGRIHVVYRERETRPDGSTLERELELDAETARLTAELKASRDEVARLEAAASRAEAREAASTRVEERRVETHNPLPDWRAGALVGVDLRGPGFVYGAQLERRILGPIYLTAGGLTNGTFVAGAGFEW